MYLKPNELNKYTNTTGEGTKENPKVAKVPRNYKLPLYLGYVIKWDLDWQTETIFYPEYKKLTTWEITPKFKKSHDRFDCGWDGRDWNFIMDVLLPKMETDDLLTDKIRKSVLLFDKPSVIAQCMRVIDMKVKDIIYPFTNVKDEDRIG